MKRKRVTFNLWYSLSSLSERAVKGFTFPSRCLSVKYTGRTRACGSWCKTQTESTFFLSNNGLAVPPVSQRYAADRNGILSGTGSRQITCTSWPDSASVWARYLVYSLLPDPVSSYPWYIPILKVSSRSSHFCGWLLVLFNRSLSCSS